MFNELKTAIFMHNKLEINQCAKELLIKATRGGAKTLGLNNKGQIKKDFDADFIVLDLEISNINNIITMIILHTIRPKMVFLKGEKV